MRLTLVVPCFNEQDNVAPFYNRVKEVFTGAAPEVIFIDDGSGDGTLARLKEIYDQNDGVRVISFSRNFGKEAAILAGLRAATGDLVCIIDSDLQQDPAVAEEMARLLEEDESADVVAAYQESRREKPFHRFCKTCFYRLSKSLCGQSLEPHVSDFRVMRRAVVNAVLSDPECERFSKGIFAWAGFKTRYVPYTVRDRFSGKSKWSTASLSRYALNGIFSFSDKPLSFVFVLSLLSFLGAVVSLVLTLVFDACLVMKVLLPVLLFLFSLLFFALWILGRYVAIALREAKRRPVYLIREDLKKEF